MPRKCLGERPLTPAERLQRFRHLGARRLEIQVDSSTFDQISASANQWQCSRQEVLRIAWQACLPAMRRANSAEEMFDQVRDALEKIGVTD